MKLEIPMRVTSPNQKLGKHWTRLRAAAKAEREAVRIAFWAHFANTRAENRPSVFGGGPVRVLLTRVGPKPLDDDNLSGAFKAVRDQVAKELGVDDADPRVIWAYGQERGPYAVRIEIGPSPD